VILAKRPEVDRFLKSPDANIRAAVIHGKDRSGVTERALTLYKAITPDLNDPFNVTFLTEADIDGDAVKLEEALTALSMIGGRRLVRIRLSDGKPSVDKAIAAALTIHAEGGYNPDAMLVIEAGALGRESALRKAAEKAAGAVGIACYEDEVGDVARMTREALGADKVGLTGDALDRFVARLPRERGLMRQEIERLVLYIGPGSGRTIDVPELEEHLGVEPDASLSDAALQAFGGRAGPAQSGLRRALAEGESAVMENCAGSTCCKPPAPAPRRPPNRRASSGNRRPRCCARPAVGVSKCSTRCRTASTRPISPPRPRACLRP